MKIEILTNKSSTLTIENQSKEIKELLLKIQQKYPDWEEFVLSNHKTEQIRVLKLMDKVVFLNRIPEIGKVIEFLDKHHFNWERIVISKKNFPVIENLIFHEGMLVREYGSNTNAYQLVKEVNGDTLKLIQEGKEWNYNIERQSNAGFKLRLLCENLINVDEFNAHGWPATKTRNK
ncbi:MAG TPA: hypothetical protein DCQ31_13365 [Bacteroidales bacterium]|nr:hypothetical protein [Bacteroidales bacterium]